MLFFEKGFHVKVRKIVPKFILDEVQNIYFVGIKSLYIDFVKNGMCQPNLRSLPDEHQRGGYQQREHGQLHARVQAVQEEGQRRQLFADA